MYKDRSNPHAKWDKPEEPILPLRWVLFIALCLTPFIWWVVQLV